MQCRHCDKEMKKVKDLGVVIIWKCGCGLSHTITKMKNEEDDNVESKEKKATT